VRQRSIYLAPWRVDVTVRDGVDPMIPLTSLGRTAAAALDATGAPSPASVALILSDDAELTRLNETHMEADGPTDVLSFPLLPPERFPRHDGQEAASAPSPASSDFVTPPGNRVHLGDIVISVERACAQAAEGRGGQTGDVHWTPGQELRLLVTHGVLHLCGWDHANPGEEAAMRGLEQQILAP
jgi:probable rRNA maturation factor